jgi:uncharacterized protein (TIGR02246 family)
MPRQKPQPVDVASPDEIEQQFYEALQQGDLDRMMALWSDDDDIACVHPGAPRAIGPAAVRASFRQMFAGARGVDISVQDVHRAQSHSSAVHSVVERIRAVTSKGEQSSWVNATNVYARTALGWRLVAHHASPGPEHDGSRAAEPGAVLH